MNNFDKLLHKLMGLIRRSWPIALLIVLYLITSHMDNQDQLLYEKQRQFRYSGCTKPHCPIGQERYHFDMMSKPPQMGEQHE